MIDEVAKFKRSASPGSMTSTPPPRLEEAIRSELAPKLRALGFAGSGRTFRRVVNGFVQVVNVQSNWYGGSFAVNLGIQPLAVTDSCGAPPNAKKITEPGCQFRRRLTPAGADHWWKHDTSRESMAVAVTAACIIFVAHGIPLLDLLCRSGGLLDSMTPDELASNPRLEGFGTNMGPMALTFARLRRSQGVHAAAAEFAALARSRTDPVATTLLAQISEFEKQ